MQLHTRLHKLEQERREQNAQKMELYTQQVALEQLKAENKDKAKLAQRLAELEVNLVLGVMSYLFYCESSVGGVLVHVCMMCCCCALHFTIMRCAEVERRCISMQKAKTCMSVWVVETVLTIV